MGIKLVFFINIITGLFSYNLFEAAPIIESTLITHSIANDSNTCANKSVIYQSKYLQQACNISFPEASSDIKNTTNINPYLCTTLYDQSVKVCHLYTTEKKELFNQTIFDEEINKTITNITKLLEVCAIRGNNLILEYNKTKPFVDKLNNYFKNPKNCADRCSAGTNENSTINPLCVMIHYIDEKIRMSQIHTKEEDVTKHDSVVTSKEAGSEKAIKQSTVASKETISTNNEPNSDKNEKVKEEKVADNSKIVNSGANPPKNDGTKSNPENPGNKTTVPINEQTNKVEVPPLEKEKENSETAVAKPDTFDQTMTNIEEDNNQHPGGDFLPEEESDQIQIDEEDKMNDQDPLVKPDDKTDGLLIHHNIEKDDDAHFFGYFTVLGLLGIGGCLAYHHKQKILAILLEGRRSRGGRGRRRPSTASYRKLDCTLEEAVTSQCNANVTHVIY
ncbi:trans-Golgi network integral membrane protein 1-like [Chelonus insularis]|uniref:trans-Golgi network integral membrane protein 1-like n=1 Tax=Chelonus insularis TaxID=460826 RepID=UPI00158BA0FB|nr:trans-Golgi network integral membrane protein 1-like [Chelonus insularis]